MSVQYGYRMPALGRVDRTRPLRFEFDGRQMQGFAGDTLASALLANGVRLVGRSFKYHRPRGILTAGPEEPNALVELRTGARREPNTKATTIELYDGLIAASQNRWPSLRFDFRAAAGLAAPLLVAGFYYKTFMWPRRAWEAVYEPLIRRAAGLGRASLLPDPDRYEKAHAFCDVLVVGAGPAGLAAALAAGRAGARVILSEQDFEAGGSLLGVRGASDWLDNTLRKLRSLPNVRLMLRTPVFGAYDGGTFGALERVNDHVPVPPSSEPRLRLWTIRTRQSIVATGAFERPLIFAGNDRPGVMLSSAVRTYLNRFGVAAGRRVAFFTCDDEGWRVAAELVAAGIEVPVIIDTRLNIDPHLQHAIGGAQVVLGGHVTRTFGWTSLRGIQAGTRRYDVDTLAVCGGWTPNVALTAHLGSRPMWSDSHAGFIPSTLPSGMGVAGSVRGCREHEFCLADGARAGALAAKECGFTVDVPLLDESAVISSLPSLPELADPRRKAFVDFQNDVTVADVRLAQREGFGSAEHLKRYTTLGMGTDQGKISNVNALLMIGQTKTTTFRPPCVPIAIGGLAGEHRGRNVKPTRLPPTHGWAQARRAVFVEAGLWLRARYFPKLGESHWFETVVREVRTVRTGVGFCDVSTLGKIDVFGPDAGTFLDRIYINTFSTLPVGKVRYGMMLREDGFAFDDGTVARLDEDHYFVTTTTANAGRVMEHLEYCLQVLWPTLDVQLVSATDQWAQLAVAGPASRTLLERVVAPGIDLSDEAVPFMATRALQLRNGFDARIYRVSFSGELAYEIAVPASHGATLADMLMDSGKSLGVIPYGTEALGVMRIEKGHVAGPEIDGRTTAADLGLSRLMSRSKDFVGRIMSARPRLCDTNRPQLAGFRCLDPAARLRGGAHFLPIGAAALACNAQGHMSSAAFSPSLGCWIGLGFIRGGAARAGERVRAWDGVRNTDTEVEVCAPVFIDPQGIRLRG